MPTVLDPFATSVRAVDEPHPAHAALRAAGPVVRVEAPDGGPAWIVTDDTLARDLLADPRVVKDPAHAPAHWDRRGTDLERTAAEQLSLTTLDGPPHAELRRAHAPLLSARRIAEGAGRMAEIARALLAELPAGEPVDLMAELTTRYPLTVVCDLLGVPLDRIDDAVRACRMMHSDDPAEAGRAMGAFAELAAAALRDGDGLATGLAERLPGGTTPDDLHYLIFTLLFTGQLTTDPALGFVLVRALRDPTEDADALVREAVRLHPPAPFTLWRFTTEEIEIAGHRLPAGAPVLVDIAGINAHSVAGRDLSYGAGAHYCIGAQLAHTELRVMVEVLRAGYPDARLAVDPGELRQAGGGLLGGRLTALPVVLGDR